MARPKKKNIYWTSDMDGIIDEYNNSSDLKFREQLFNEKIHQPFVKLIECIHNKYNWPFITDDYETRMMDILGHLMVHISKYKKEKGNAYGYFNMIARNYLIMKNTKSLKEAKRAGCYEEVYAGDEITTAIFAVQDASIAHQQEAQNKEKITDFTLSFMTHLEKNIDLIFPKPDGRVIARAFVELVQACGYEVIIKRDFLKLMREKTGFKTNKISKIISSIKAYYRNVKKAWLNGASLKAPKPAEYLYYKNFRNWKSQLEKKQR